MAESSNQPKNCILSRSSFQRIIKTLESYMDKKGIKYMNQRADCRYIHDETSENHKPYENIFSELNAWSLALEKRLVCVSYSRTSTMFTPLPSRLMQAYIISVSSHRLRNFLRQFTRWRNAILALSLVRRSSYKISRLNKNSTDIVLKCDKII